MPQRFGDFVNQAIIEHFNTLELRSFKSRRLLCKYLSYKFKISPEHAYKLIKDKIEQPTIFGYILRDDIEPEVAKFIIRHRRNAIKTILGKIYIREDIIDSVYKKLGLKEA